MSVHLYGVNVESALGHNEERRITLVVLSTAKRNRVHRKQVARIKHRGGRGRNSDRTEKEGGNGHDITKLRKIDGEKSVSSRHQ
jgi:hypothetical protein